MIIRVLEIGGSKIRRADVFSKKDKIEISDLTTFPTHTLTSSPNITGGFLKLAYGQGLKKGTDAIVYAVAGPVKDHKTIELLPNVASWRRDTDLVKITKEKLKIPAIVLNDMEAAVTGMAHLLRKNWQKSFWGITWSSGIGGRYWDGNRIVSEAEIGHMTLDLSPNAPLCSCRAKGHAEAIIGGKAIERKIKLMSPLSKNPCAALNKAFLKKEKWAIDFYKTNTHFMGILLANLVQVNPAELICFKGTFGIEALKLPGIKEEIIKIIKKSVISPSWAVKEIIKSPEPKNDSLIGAALVAGKLLE